jgi:hypothetical protein
VWYNFGMAKEQREMRPDEFRVVVNQDPEGGARITITPGINVARKLQDAAFNRGKIIPEMVAESLRLERLLADGKLYIREDGQVRKLISV